MESLHHGFQVGLSIVTEDVRLCPRRPAIDGVLGSAPLRGHAQGSANALDLFVREVRQIDLA